MGLPHLGLRQVGRLVALAATGLAGFNWCLVEGAKRSDPAFLAAVVGATPLVLALAAPMVTGGRIRRQTVAGGAVVGVGVVAVQAATEAPIGAVPYAVGFLLCEVAFTLLAVPLLRILTPVELSAAVCGVAAPLLLVLALVEPGRDFVVPSAAEAAVLVYMAVLTTAVAFLLWYGGVVRLGADRAGLFAGVMPVSGLVAGLVAGTSTWSVGGSVGSLLCAGGIAIGLAARRRPRPRQVP